MDLFGVQLTVLLCLLLGNVLFGILPLILGKAIEHFSNSEDALSKKAKCATFLLYTGVGVFISNSFLVLLPQANHEISHGTNHTHEHTGTSSIQQKEHSEQDSGHHHDSFPIPEFIVLCGFFLAYILQEAIYFLLSKCSRQPKEPANMRVSFCSCAKRHTECSRTFKADKPDQTLFGLEKKLMESENINIASSSGDATNMLSTTNMPQEIEINAQSDLLRSSILAQTVPNYGTVTNVTEPTLDNPLPALTPPVHLADERRLLKTQHSEKRQQYKFLTSSLLIVLSLILQYIFQGIYLGLQSEDSSQWFWLVACFQHFILTFSVGSYLAVGNMEFLCVAFVTGLLSIVPPIGMIVAMVNKSVVTEISHQAIGVVFAVACGILLYSTFYEMLRQKSYGSVVGLVKLSAITIGAGITILLQYANIVISNKR